MQIDYRSLFHQVHPGFFEQAHIRSLPDAYVFSEMLLPLAEFSPTALEIPTPARITFGVFEGDHAALLDSVRLVDPDWVQYFSPGDRVYCGFDGGRVVSFCLLDDFGEYQGLRIGAPGCVGTIPSHRGQGIGLKLVQGATAALQADGYDLSYIHYTHLAHWYGRLGYQTVLKWNGKGLLP